MHAANATGGLLEFRFSQPIALPLKFWLLGGGCRFGGWMFDFRNFFLTELLTKSLETRWPSRSKSD
jgi:hypothetical protein